jgi:hypothetical protein
MRTAEITMGWIKTLEIQLIRRRTTVSIILAVTCLLFATLEYIGRSNDINYYMNEKRYRMEEWQGWRFSFSRLITSERSAVGHWHNRIRCGGREGSNLGPPCNPAEVNSHSETYAFLWFTWKRQLPMDDGDYLKI